jgi:hypothetical protein
MASCRRPAVRTRIARRLSARRLASSYFDEKLGGIMTGGPNAPGFLLGGKTYQIFAASCPKSTVDDFIDRAATEGSMLLAFT